MALSGLDIYKLLPKTNCKKCGSPTCLAFAMRLATKKGALEECPDVSEEAKAALETASQPPIRLVSFGTGEKKAEVGGETVLFRHEKTFYHPTAIAIRISDVLSQDDFAKTLEEINSVRIERVGQVLEVDAVAIFNDSKDKSKFAKAVKYVVSNTELALILVSEDVAIMKEAVEISAEKKPLLCCANSANFDEMAALANEKSVPLVVAGGNLEETDSLAQKAVSSGLKDIVLDCGARDIFTSLQDFTQIRRLALKRNYRSLGFPIIAWTQGALNLSEDLDIYKEVAEAAGFIAKYASIVVVGSTKKEVLLPIMTVRQNIYTDPQKPVTVEPKLYEIGSPDENSPLIVTTNFSLTFFTVSPEIESSKISAYLMVTDSEGMSVLTAWAAEKFTAEQVAADMKKYNLEERLANKQVIIPGYVAVMSGKLEEESGWKVLVGPKEASGLPKYLKGIR